ncbi:MAG: hypothetical protein A2161_13870, partial [Candidatus Schekmanbacteria bacterium RBG_13_48_7]
RFAEHLVVGISAGYWTAILWRTNLLPLLAPLFKGEKYILIIPLILGFMILFRFWPEYSWLSRWPIAFILGISSGIVIPLVLRTRVLLQVQGSIQPINLLQADGWNQLIVVISTICALAYFYFSKAHKGVFGGIAQVGVVVLMIGFGATFGYTVMSRISLLIGRMHFLLSEWLGILT